MPLLKLKYKLVLMGLCFGVSSCGAPSAVSGVTNSDIADWRPAQETPRTDPVDVAQIGNQFEQPKQSPLRVYASASDFKAVATNESGIQGAGANEQSLFIAEREALKDCTRRSEYQGECKSSQVGNFALTGLDDQKDQQRWRYIRSVHQTFASRTPLRVSYTAKVLAPGSIVGDATLSLSSTFANGGYAALKMPGYTCSGTLDPIDQSSRDVENDDKPIGLLEMACQSGQLLYGGYATVNEQTHLFYLEDSENERWEFLVAPNSRSIGNNTILFKRLFVEIEEQD